jgi:hypothetical protein
MRLFRSLLFFSCAFSVLVGFTGCTFNSGSGAATWVAPVPGTQTLHGGVMGGQQPVVGATIQMYKVGTSGFQSASTAMFSPALTTSATGTFNFTVSCGSATQVYLVATSGNAGSGTNPNIAMMAALGPCSSITASTYININEQTTVAAVAALAPYMASMTSIGSSSGGTYTGDEALSVAQAFTLAQALVDSGAGTSPGTNVPSGYSVPSTLVASLANVIAACINSPGGTAGDSSSCGQLFTLTTVNGTAPTNTVQALLNIANHPTVNTTNLYNLGSSAGPFQPTLPAAPASFDIGLTPSSTATVTRTMYVLPDNGVNFLYTLVNNAQSTIDFTMYGLADTTLSGDLVAACQRGVKVRVILDQNSEKSIDTAAYNQLNAQTNCSAAWANPAFQVTHQKTMTFDGTTSAILSLNTETSSYAGTRDFAIVTNDANDVAAIEATFNADYGSTTDYSYVPSLGDNLIWSPTNARAALVGLINNATATLNVENEEMSDPTVVGALEAACTRGVTTHIIMTNSSSYTSDFTALKNAGCSVHLFANSTKVIYIHAKVIVADDGTTAQYGYMGSINFSTASLVENRELGTYVSDAGMLSTLNTTLNTDYTNAPAY